MNSNFLEGNLLQQLSAVFKNKDEFDVLSNVLSAVNMLSAVPAHPYEQAKHFLFGPEYKYPSLNEIEIPENYNPQTYQAALTAASKTLADMTMTKIAEVSSQEMDLKEVDLEKLEAMEKRNPFNEQIEADPELIKKNIIFSEVVRNITVEQIDSNPLEVLQKLNHFYFDVLNPYRPL